MTRALTPEVILGIKHRTEKAKLIAPKQGFDALTLAYSYSTILITNAAIEMRHKDYLTRKYVHIIK